MWSSSKEGQRRGRIVRSHQIIWALAVISSVCLLCFLFFLNSIWNHQVFSCTCSTLKLALMCCSCVSLSSPADQVSVSHAYCPRSYLPPFFQQEKLYFFLEPADLDNCLSDCLPEYQRQAFLCTSKSALAEG